MPQTYMQEIYGFATVYQVFYFNFVSQSGIASLGQEQKATFHQIFHKVSSGNDTTDERFIALCYGQGDTQLSKSTEMTSSYKTSRVAVRGPTTEGGSEITVTSQH